MQNQPSGRVLLATITSEPFQPVRLYYVIPHRGFVTKKFRGLECVVEAPDEGHPDELMKNLDRDVTVIDPRVAEAERDFKGVRTREDAERVAAEGLQRRLRDKEDVPMVEDFPLAPEEETPEFLVQRFLPWAAVAEIGVMTPRVAEAVVQALRGADHRPPVTTRREWYS